MLSGRVSSLSRVPVSGYEDGDSRDVPAAAHQQAPRTLTHTTHFANLRRWIESGRLPRKEAVGQKMSSRSAMPLAEGLGVSPGRAQGPVRRVCNVAQLADIREGDILVTRASSPAWTTGMMKAAGFVCEFGGLICHAAITAREMGVPCVVGIPNVMELLRDGQEIAIDGAEGTIHET